MNTVSYDLTTNWQGMIKVSSFALFNVLFPEHHLKSYKYIDSIRNIVSAFKENGYYFSIKTTLDKNGYEIIKINLLEKCKLKKKNNN